MQDDLLLIINSLNLLNIDQASVSSSARMVARNGRAMLQESKRGVSKSAKSTTGLILDGKYVVGVGYEEYMDVNG